MNKLEWFEVLEQLELVDAAVINGRSTDFRIEFDKLYDLIYGKAENAAEHEGWYGEFEEHLDSLEDKYINQSNWNFKR